jgi:hypothetical protein
MKILTWNLGLYYWCKYYKKFNLKLNNEKVEHEYFQKQYVIFVADFIKKYNPEICFLQEFYSLEDIEILRSLLNGYFTDYKILNSWYKKESILVLSKSNIDLEKIQDTSFYKISSFGVNFLPVHLNSFSAVKRYNQLISLGKSLEGVDCILGDTNFWSYKNNFLFNKDRLSYGFLINKGFKYIKNNIGYTSKFFLNFDRVFYKGKHDTIKTEVVKTSKKLMDHYPVLFCLD